MSMKEMTTRFFANQIRIPKQTMLDHRFDTKGEVIVNFWKGSRDIQMNICIVGGSYYLRFTKSKIYDAKIEFGLPMACVLSGAVISDKNPLEFWFCDINDKVEMQNYFINLRNAKKTDTLINSV